MLIYVIMNKVDTGICDILGVFTEYEKATLHWREYIADKPEEECWIETHDADVWLHEAQQEYKIIHKTMVSKNMGMVSHTVSVSTEELPISLVEEGQGWYTIRQAIDTFDEAEGKARNLQQLNAYLQKK